MVKRMIGQRIGFALLLLPLAIAGCGKGADDNDGFAGMIGKTIEDDCLRLVPAEGKTAQEHRQLCTCSGDKIRASGIRAEDGDAANNEKIHAAQQACRQQVKGDGA